MTTTPASPSPATTTDATLPRCIVCAYLLRGLDESADCPECGTPVAQSMLGDRLARAEPHWLRTVVRGQTLLSIGPFVAIGAMTLGLLAFILPMIVNIATDGGTQLPTQRWAGVISSWGVSIAVLPIALGALMVTAQEPRDKFEEPALSARRLARWGMPAFAVSWLVPTALHTAGVAPAWLWAVEEVAETLTLTVAAAAMLRYLGRLADRVPRHELGDSSRRAAAFISWAVPFIGVTSLLEEAGVALSGTMGPDAPLVVVANILRGVMGCTSVVLVLVLLVQAVSLIGLMLSLGAAFRAAQRESEAAA